MNKPHTWDYQRPEAKKGNASMSFLKECKDDFVHLLEASAWGRQGSRNLGQDHLISSPKKCLNEPSWIGKVINDAESKPPQDAPFVKTS